MGLAENEIKQAAVTEHILGSVFITLLSRPQQAYTLSFSARSELRSGLGWISMATVKIKIRYKCFSEVAMAV